MDEHASSDYWTRTHPEAVVLDIGEDVGALVLYTPAAFHNTEIEVSPINSHGPRVHAAVLEREVDGQNTFAAVYPELAAGTYVIWADDPNRTNEVTIVAGSVAEVDWR